MSNFPKAFRHFIPQLIQMIVLPIFFFAFMLIYSMKWNAVTIIRRILLLC